MNYAHIATSPRLQRLHDFIARPGWHTTRDISRGAEIMAVNSAVAELRKNGATIECKQTKINGRRVWAYRLVVPPTAAPCQDTNTNEKPERLRLLAGIHAQAKEAGMTEEQRRNLQIEKTGKSTAKLMTLEELRLVKSAIYNWRPVFGKPFLAVDSNAENSVIKMRGKIKAQLAALNAQDAYADKIARRMYQKNVFHLNSTELRSVIAALTKAQEKAGC